MTVMIIAIEVNCAIAYIESRVSHEEVLVPQTSHPLVF